MTQQSSNVPFAGDTVNHESVEVENIQTEEKVEEKVPEKEVTPEEQLTQLEEFRSKGSISIDMTYEQFRKMRNTFKNDIYIHCSGGDTLHYLICQKRRYPGR